MPHFIDKNTSLALQTDLLMEQIMPVSEPGRKCKLHEKVYIHGEEEKLVCEYDMIHLMMNFRLQEPGDFIVLQDLLKNVEDIHGTIRRCESNVLALHEIFEIKHFLYYVLRIQKILISNSLKAIAECHDFQELFEYLDQDKQNQPHFYLSDAYSKELSSIREKLNTLSSTEKQWFLNTRTKAARSLGMEMVGYDVVIDRANTAQLEKIEKSPFFREGKSNFNNRVFHLKETPELTKMRSEMQKLQKKLEQVEAEVLTVISKKIGLSSKHLANALNTLAELDLRMAKASFGLEHYCCIPKIIKKKSITLRKSVNIPLKMQLSEISRDYEEMDIVLKNKLNIVIGANMAGKTSALKSVGQAAFLASHAIPIPAESAELPLFNFIFFSGEDSQRKQPDLSSFARDVVAMQEALEQKGFGLFLVDEFARGTNPVEGEALCAALLSTMILKNAITFSATHFQAPANISEAGHFLMSGLSESDFKALSILPVKERIQELNRRIKYSLLPVTKGQKVPQVAIRIAEILGLDLEVIVQAKDNVVQFT
ncbi:MAG TPA: hypothetical protein PLE74_00785 [Candidatus Cloacimonadota bacterium]|nr:hypothetical protein [Candidatus Cloacimonadota bacterium]HPT70797.1 hypothetical protein [Candidatus Cloacimonadota bacterium]